MPKEKLGVSAATAAGVLEIGLKKHNKMLLRFSSENQEFEWCQYDMAPIAIQRLMNKFCEKCRVDDLSAIRVELDTIKPEAPKLRERLRHIIYDSLGQECPQDGPQLETAKTATQ